jgi:hypothetical protein
MLIVEATTFGLYVYNNNNTKKNVTIPFFSFVVVVVVVVSVEFCGTDWIRETDRPFMVK